MPLCLDKRIFQMQDAARDFANVCLSIISTEIGTEICRAGLWVQVLLAPIALGGKYDMAVILHD